MSLPASTGMDEPRPSRRAKQMLSPEEQGFAITTWRYIRLAMAVLVVGLAVAIVDDWISVHSDCLQTSISAYYYTSVHAYFVGALIAIGVCLFCLKGSTESEDVALNLAGIFALVVGLVPTPHPGRCGVVSGTTQHIHDNVVNNVTALLVVGALALAILGALMLKARLSRAARIGYVIAAVLWLGGGAVFIAADHFFVKQAHPIAAALMFLCIFVVVCINARDYEAKGHATWVRNYYWAIAVAMGLAIVGFLVAGALGWSYWIFGIESALIVLFAAFWLMQTNDLWDQGLR